MKGAIDYGPQGGDGRSYMTDAHASLTCTQCHKTHDFTPIEDPRTDSGCTDTGCHPASGPLVVGNVTDPGVVHTNHIIAATATRLSIRVSATSLARKKSVTVRSALSGGVPAGTLVVYEVKKPGARSYSLLRSAVVGSSGASSVSFKLISRGVHYFRVRFLGNARFGVSSAITGKVTAR